MSKNIKEGSDVKSMIIFGGRGSGKTVLGTLMLRDIISTKQESVKFVDYSTLATEVTTIYLNEERERFSPNSINKITITGKTIGVDMMRGFLDG